MQQLANGLFGFFLGGLVTLAILAGVGDSINWLVVGIAASICAVLAAFFGSDFLSWLKETWWWS